ncbi:hypothetical protein JYK14_14570 [Siccirubricoccus sp. KC 17139]|uniref:SMI1/KNR4 family protein n=1 Tax=Siccirubricoccus soli TaxID=2899147 RepID=A0ABT1D621_9PROT|nr:hypothetical protein [Siccirubricoccus soli]MCO6417380.1 hypothetical protein [Siccirubricoccus soli]MCP2683515.1 hypothetical protein [Siccirubricoccus soli]
MSGTTTPPGETPAPGLPSVEEAFLLLRRAGLRLPPIPRELVAGFTRTGEATWQSGDIPPGDLDAVLAAGPATPPALGFGHLGHGTNSWHFVYHLVTPSLSLFLRIPYGGTESSDPASLAAVNAALIRTEELVVAADAQAAAGRTLVVDDALGQSWWRRAGSDRVEESENPLAAALAA